MSQTDPADNDTRSVDIYEVSLILQDRLGLAKLKYQHGHLHRPSSNPPLDSDKSSDSSLGFLGGHCETPFKYHCHRAAIYSHALARSDRNKFAVTFNRQVMQHRLPSVSPRRLRSNTGAGLPAKAPRIPWKNSYQLFESSPGVNRHSTARKAHAPFVSEASVPELSSSGYQGSSDEENEPDLPLYSFQNMSFMADCFFSRTPPPKYARLPCNNQIPQHEYRAGVQGFATPASSHVAADSPGQAFPPSTPPNKQTTLPSLSPSLGTPCQQFNFADFVNMTPSPAQPVWTDRTRRYRDCTSPSTKDACKGLELNELVHDNIPSPKLQ